MAERAGGAGGIGLVAGCDDKQHAAGAQRQKALTRVDRAHAHGAGGVVATTAGHDDARGQAQGLRHGGLQIAAGGAALHQPGHVGLGQTGERQQRVGPVALPHVQPQRAAGVRQVGHVLTGEHQPHVVLG
ncbi:hypothetical protein D9M69_594480 [compost metagenome]